MMNESQRIQLSNMIRENNVVDQTPLIRQLKHSAIMRENVNTLLDLKAVASDDELNILAAEKCSFLFTYYTDIYNKLRKDEIDVDILFKLIDKLQEIEENKLDQHEASFEVGTILKKIYVDSALRKADKLDKQYGKDVAEIKEVENISWKDYKNGNISWNDYKGGKL